MDEKTIIKDAIEYIHTVFENDCTGHDAEHSLRVFSNAIKIAETEEKGNRMIILLAALLHDVDDHKLFETKNNYNARMFLERHNVENETIEEICKIINGVSFSQNKGIRPDTIEGMIVQDADRLDAIGAIGIARTFAYGGSQKRTLANTINHFYEKLLLIKGEMNTNEGKRMAENRHSFMETYLREIGEEIELIDLPRWL